MIRHGPTCLDGPVTKDRSWWVTAAAAGAALAAAEDTVAEIDIRPDLVRRVRAEIAAGTYDTPEKLELALGRLVDLLTAE